MWQGMAPSVLEIHNHVGCYERYVYGGTCCMGGLEHLAVFWLFVLVGSFCLWERLVALTVPVTILG